VRKSHFQISINRLFHAGCAPDNFDDEQPQRLVELSPFWIDRYEVTNRQFRAFVNDTNYVTPAEERGQREVLRDMRPISPAGYHDALAHVHAVHTDRQQRARCCTYDITTGVQRDAAGVHGPSAPSG